MILQSVSYALHAAAIPCCCWSLWAHVLREPHVDIFLGLGVHEQHTVLACLLDHAHVEIVPLCALLLNFGVLVHQAGEERAVLVRVLGHEVEAHAGGDPDDTPEEPALSN